MKSFYFTKKLDNLGHWGYVEVKAETSLQAREKMVEAYGLDWGFEYNELEQVHPLDRTLIAKLD